MHMSCGHNKALGLARDGRLAQAHALVKDHTDQLSCLIHAYIHRAAGDLDNADYWYRHANTTPPYYSLQAELESLYAKVQAHE